MSNIGKSYWSKRLAAEWGYTRVDCDALVDARLPIDQIYQGHKTLEEDMAAWMGLPYESRYAGTSIQYLTTERAVMQDVFERLRTAPHGSKFIVDTTGSLVYTGDSLCAELKKLTRIIYLEASPEHAAELFKNYMANPKPVIWGNDFTQREGEAPQEALRRCYPALLATRARRYRQLADIVIPYDEHRKSATDPRVLMRLMGQW
jgi:shikimate kinase